MLLVYLWIQNPLPDIKQMSKCFKNSFHLFNVIGKAGKGEASDDEDEDEEA